MTKTNDLDDLAQSMELAGQIDMIKVVLFQMDEEYLKQCIETFRKQASFQDSTAVLSPRYDSTKSILLNVQAATMEALLSFWQGLKKCEELKGQIAENDKSQEAIRSLFFLINPPMTQLTDKHYAIPMPEGAENCELRGAHPGRPYPLLSFYGEGEAVELPVGEYQIVVFNTGTATEEQAASVVQIISNGRISGRPQYRRYDRDKELPARMWTRDARHSLETLLRSKGLDDKNNYALIEKLSSERL